MSTTTIRTGQRTDLYIEFTVFFKASEFSATLLTVRGRFFPLYCSRSALASFDPAGLAVQQCSSIYIAVQQCSRTCIRAEVFYQQAWILTFTICSLSKSPELTLVQYCRAMPGPKSWHRRITTLALKWSRGCRLFRSSLQTAEV